MEKGEVLGCGCQGTHHLYKMLVISSKFLLCHQITFHIKTIFWQCFLNHILSFSSNTLTGFKWWCRCTDLSLKGVCHKIFDLQFFLWFEPIWAPDKQAKIFSNLVSILLRYSNFLKNPRCASHCGVRLCGVLHSTESSSTVCIPPRSQTPRCASHRGVKLRSVHHTSESSDEEFSKKSVVCILLRSLTPQCASYRGVKLRGVHYTAESITYQVSVLIRSFRNAISLSCLKILIWNGYCKSKIV